MIKLPRFTVGWLMVLVAVTGLILGLGIPASHYGRLAREYRVLADTAARDAQGDLKYVQYWKAKLQEESKLANPSPDSLKLFEKFAESNRRASEYHRLQALRYDRAARSPWLALEPEPPFP